MAVQQSLMMNSVFIEKNKRNSLRLLSKPHRQGQRMRKAPTPGPVWHPLQALCLAHSLGLEWVPHRADRHRRPAVPSANQEFKFRMSSMPANLVAPRASLYGGRGAEDLGLGAS